MIFLHMISQTWKYTISRSGFLIFYESYALGFCEILISVYQRLYTESIEKPLQMPDLTLACLQGITADHF